ncbi:ATP-grasp domain-containing protein [Actinokineospora cianjurensis]|uniref:Diaminopimelate decarboxylase n=1 Tax=Actinokineospora cianjurensis TaxID=585224 RepID=A0A421AY89_9PSEU|nr:ATP-grasp domain-containing protein [Actinokineospora cianjurensis]RLK54806.1 diaminopimelate decarboxylase [Actinokineospora cianjurensis]
MSTPAVVLSGVHSGPNPSPGLGLARSLRSAWPRLRLEAVDYSPRSTGLSASEFDRVHVRPGWHDADLDALCAGLLSIVESAGAVFLPGLDLEAALLADRRPGHPALLLPPSAAFDAVVKPGETAASLLGLAVPEYRFAEGVEDGADFAVRHGWRVWVKGSRYEAVATNGRAELAAAIAGLRATWGGETLLQRHVDGAEESVVFAALDGELLGACAMRKTMVTAEGKTWAGSVDLLDPPTRARLVDLVRITRWTGGGEVEIVREADTGIPYLLEVNPRFPAWIHGATLAGVNLPARLVAAATGIPRQEREKAHSTGFVRVVEEIPAGPHAIGVVPTGQHGLSCDGELPGHCGADSPAPGGKHPSGMPVLSRRLALPRPRPRPVDLDHRRAADIADALLVDPYESPARVYFGGVLDRGLDRLAGVCRDVEDATGVPTRFAYSVKTNPDPRVLGAVLRRGALVEVISQAEARRCAAAGFPGDRVVLGGPAKWWRFDGGPVKFGAVFCDSVGDLERTLALVAEGGVYADVLGLRLAPPGVPSRFGVDVTCPRAYRAVADALRDAPVGRLGLQFHHAASQIGLRAWLREFTAAVTVAADLLARADVRARCLDLGGGWPPGLGRAELGAQLVRATRAAVRELGSLDQVLFEPGKHLVEPAMAVFTTVLDVRDGRHGRAAVVDASIAELPDWGSHPHPVLWRAPGAPWRRLPPGDESVFGRLCMEHDRPRAGLTLPDGIAEGDHLLFLDAGAYDASMSFRFGV